MKTHLLITGALVFALSFLTLPFKADAQLAGLNPTGMESTFQDLSIFPNPFNDQFIVNYTLANENQVAIEVYNALGEKVREYSQSAVRQNAGTYQITITRPAGMESGLYFVRLTVPDEGSLTQRVMAK